jgi:hypothetical protein
VRKFVRAWTEAIAFFAQKPTETQEILRKHIRLNDPEILRSTYEFYRERLPKSPRISEKSFSALIEAMTSYNPKVQTVSFNQVVDMSFVDQMEKDGFIASLYR